jgi:hypothetical protein
MTPPHPTPAADPRQEPGRWDHDQMARAFDHFSSPDCETPQRQYAQQHGIPRSTLGAWLRQPPPDGVEPLLADFFRSQVGQRFLRRLILALFLVFLFRGAVGLRLLALFLQYSQLDRFVASSVGALHELSQSLQSQLLAYGQEERSRLAASMVPKDIALVPDENFHGDSPCLVAIEPVSNFILVEQYSARRDAATWTAAITQAVADLPVTVRLLSSDQARGLLACAETGLQAEHLPELFHGQRDLARPLLGPLARQTAAAEKDEQHALEMDQYWQQEKAKAAAGPPRPGRQTDFDSRCRWWQQKAAGAQQRRQTCADRQQEARAGVRGLADDYHPFDRQTGQPVSVEQMTQRLEQRLQGLQRVAAQGELGAAAAAALTRGQCWVVTLVGVLAWFWSVTRQRLVALELPAEAERLVEEKLLSGLYWQAAARRGRTAAERQPLQELAERLLQEAWSPTGALGKRSAAERSEIERVAREVVGLFARSSSCVEGRNGRLSLFHHGQSRLGSARLGALTVVHNYLSERGDGTTAAERFFGQKPRDAFQWLLERLPDLPRPATKRPRQGAQAAPASE